MKVSTKSEFESGKNVENLPADFTLNDPNRFLNSQEKTTNYIIYS